MRRSTMKVLWRALVYFAIAFGAGFVLGTLRVLVWVPRFGERASELAEAPLMLAVTILAARFVVRRFPATDRRSHLWSGGVALGLLLALEFSVVLWLRGLSLAEYAASRDPIAGSVYVALLAAFALMPWLVSRRASAQTSS
jgi:hypothetical protein